MEETITKLENELKYYKTEYNLICSSLRQKNKEIKRLKDEITKKNILIQELQKSNEEEIETLF